MWPKSYHDTGPQGTSLRYLVHHRTLSKTLDITSPHPYSNLPYGYHITGNIGENNIWWNIKQKYIGDLIKYILHFNMHMLALSMEIHVCNSCICGHRVTKNFWTALYCTRLLYSMMSDMIKSFMNTNSVLLLNESCMHLSW